MSISDDIPPRDHPSFQNWLHQGEELYSVALEEYESIERQLDELEGQLAAKLAEVNRIGRIIGRPAIEGIRRLAARLVPAPAPELVPHTTHNIARALNGTLGR